MLTAGDVLGGRYRLDERIASGGMGDVWRATDTVLGRGVAIKMLDARRRDDPGFQTRFRHEARAMAMLHHPGVADVYDYGETSEGDDAYIVMAYIDGQPLNERIAEAGRLDPAETLSIVAQAARALHAAHTAGIVHRDVKPGNLIIKPDGTAVLVDFGVARSAGSATLTGVNEVVGTALYIAPEQVSKKTIGPATDIYALGAVAYHCLAGHPPYPGSNPLAVAMSHLNDEPPPLPADVPQPVRELVTTAMAKDPADRFPTAAEMADAATRAETASADTAIAVGGAAGVGAGTTAVMAAAGDDATVPVPLAGETAPDGPRTSRRPLVWAGALVALVAGGIALALLLPGALSDAPGEGPGDTPVSPQVETSGSPGGGQSGDEPGTTTGPTEQPQPSATAGDDGEPTAEPTPPGDDGTEATPPPDDEEPTEPDPTVAEPAPTASAGQDALPTPATVATGVPG
jgi:serine/threonine-protein kinase